MAECKSQNPDFDGDDSIIDEWKVDFGIFSNDLGITLHLNVI